MQIAAAKAIASLVSYETLSTTNIISEAFRGGVADIVAKSISSAVTEA